MASSDLLPQDIKVKSEDVTLACAFIPDAGKRAEVLSLFAFLETLREIPERVSDPLMGEIRLRWWYEAIEEIAAKKTPRYHPLTGVLQALIAQHELKPQNFYDLIEGQMPLLDKGALTTKDAMAVADRGEGIVLRLAARILGAESGGLADAARLIGMAQIMGTRGISDAGVTELAHLKREAARAVKALPVELTPLALPATLAAGVWHKRPQGPLRKRLSLFLTFVTGQI